MLPRFPSLTRSHIQPSLPINVPFPRIPCRLVLMAPAAKMRAPKLLMVHASGTRIAHLCRAITCGIAAQLITPYGIRILTVGSAGRRILLLRASVCGRRKRTCGYSKRRWCRCPAGGLHWVRWSRNRHCDQSFRAAWPKFVMPPGLQT